jgi:hypothetical protein
MNEDHFEIISSLILVLLVYIWKKKQKKLINSNENSLKEWYTIINEI